MDSSDKIAAAAAAAAASDEKKELAEEAQVETESRALQSTQAIFADYLCTIDALADVDLQLLKQFLGKVTSISSKASAPPAKGSGSKMVDHRIVPAIVARHLKLDRRGGDGRSFSSKSQASLMGDGANPSIKTFVQLKCAYGSGFNLSNSLSTMPSIKGSKRSASEPIDPDLFDPGELDSSKSKISLAAYINSSRRLSTRVTAKLLAELLSAIHETHKMYMTCCCPDFRRSGLGTDKERAEMGVIEDHAFAKQINAVATTSYTADVADDASIESLGNSSISSNGSSVKSASRSSTKVAKTAKVAAKATQNRGVDVVGYFKSLQGKLEDIDKKKSFDNYDNIDGNSNNKSSKDIDQSAGVCRFTYRYSSRYPSTSIHNNIISLNNIIMTDDASIREVLETARSATLIKDSETLAKEASAAAAKKTQSDYKKLMANAKKGGSQDKFEIIGSKSDNNVKAKDGTKNNGMQMYPPKSKGKGSDSSDPENSDDNESRSSSRTGSRPSTVDQVTASPTSKGGKQSRGMMEEKKSLEKSQSSYSIGIATGGIVESKGRPAGRLPPPSEIGKRDKDEQQQSGSLASKLLQASVTATAENLRASLTSASGTGRRRKNQIENWYLDREPIITELKNVEGQYNTNVKKGEDSDDDSDSDEDEKESLKRKKKKALLRSGWIDIFPLKLGGLLTDVTRGNAHRITQRSQTLYGSPSGKDVTAQEDSSNHLGDRSPSSSPSPSPPRNRNLPSLDLDGPVTLAWSPAGKDKEVKQEGVNSLEIFADLPEDSYFKRTLLLKTKNSQGDSVRSTAADKIKRLHKDYKEINSNWIFDDLCKLDMAGTGAITLRSGASLEHINLMYQRFSQFVLNVQRDMRQFGQVVFAILLKRALDPNEMTFLDKVIIVDKSELAIKRPKRRKKKDPKGEEKKKDGGGGDGGGKSIDVDLMAGNDLSDDDEAEQPSSSPGKDSKSKHSKNHDEESSDSSDEDAKPQYGDQRDPILNQGRTKMTIDMLYERFECPRFNRAITNLLCLLFAPIVLPYNPYAPKPLGSGPSNRENSFQKRFKFLRFEKYGESIQDFKSIFQDLDEQTKWVRPVFWNPQLERDRLRVVYERQAYLAESAEFGLEDTLERLREYDYMVWFHMQPDAVRKKIMQRKKFAEISDKNKADRYKLLHMASIHYWERKEFKKWMLVAFSDYWKFTKALQKKHLYNLNGRKHLKTEKVKKKDVESRPTTANSLPPSRQVGFRTEKKISSPEPSPSPPKNRNVFIGSPTKSVGKDSSKLPPTKPGSPDPRGGKPGSAVETKGKSVTIASPTPAEVKQGVGTKGGKIDLKTDSKTSKDKPTTPAKPGTSSSKGVGKPGTANSTTPANANSNADNGPKKPGTGKARMNKHSMEYHEMMKMINTVDGAFPVHIITKYLNFRQFDEVLTNNPNFTEFDYQGDFANCFMIFFKDLTEALLDQFYVDPKRPSASLTIDESIKALFDKGYSKKVVDKRDSSPLTRASSRAASRRSRQKSRGEMKVRVFDNTSQAESEAQVFNSRGNADDNKKWVNPCIVHIRRARDEAFAKIDNSPILMMMSGEQLKVKTEVVVVENLIRTLSIVKAVIIKFAMAIDYLNEDWIMAVFHVTLSALFAKYMKDLPNISKGEGFAANRMVASFKMMKIRRLMKAIFRQAHAEVEAHKKAEKAKKTLEILADSDAVLDKIIKQQEKAMELPKEGAVEEEGEGDDERNPSRPGTTNDTRVSGPITKQNRREFDLLNQISIDTFTHMNCRHREYELRFHQWSFDFSGKQRDCYYYTGDYPEFTALSFNVNIDFALSNYKIGSNVAFKYSNITQDTGDIAKDPALYKAIPLKPEVKNITALAIVLRHPSNNINRFDSQVHVSNLGEEPSNAKDQKKSLPGEIVILVIDNRMPCDLTNVCECLYLHLLEEVREVREVFFVNHPDDDPLPPSESIGAKQQKFNFDPINNLASCGRTPLVLPYSVSLENLTTKFYNDGCDHTQIAKVKLMVGHLLSNASYNVQIYYNNVFAPKIDKVRHKRNHTYYYEFTYKWRADDSDFSLLQRYNRFQTRATVPGAVAVDSVVKDLAVVYALEPTKLLGKLPADSRSSQAQSQSEGEEKDDNALFTISYIGSQQRPSPSAASTIATTTATVPSPNDSYYKFDAPVLALRIHLNWDLPNFNGSTCAATIIKRKFVVYYRREVPIPAVAPLSANLQLNEAKDETNESKGSDASVGEEMTASSPRILEESSEASQSSLIEEVTVFASRWTTLNNDGEIEERVKDSTDKRRKSNVQAVLSSYTDFVNIAEEVVKPRRGDIENFWVGAAAPLLFSAAEKDKEERGGSESDIYGASRGGVGLFTRFYYSIRYLTEDGLLSRECKVKVDSSSKATILLKPHTPIDLKPHKGYSIVKGGLYAKLSIDPNKTSGGNSIKTPIQRDVDRSNSEKIVGDSVVKVDKEAVEGGELGEDGRGGVEVEPKVKVETPPTTFERFELPSIVNAETEVLQQMRSISPPSEGDQRGRSSSPPLYGISSAGSVNKPATPKLLQESLANLEVDFWLSGLSSNLPTLKLKAQPPSGK